MIRLQSSGEELFAVPQSEDSEYEDLPSEKRIGVKVVKMSSSHMYRKTKFLRKSRRAPEITDERALITNHRTVVGRIPIYQSPDLQGYSNINWDCLLETLPSNH